MTLTVVEVGRGFIELEGATAKDLVPLMRKERNGDLVLLEFPLDNDDENEVDQTLEVLIDADDILLCEGGRKFHVMVSTEVDPDD